MSTGKETPQKFSKFGETFVSYGSYHHNLMYICLKIRNKIIHIICVPIITATFLAMLTYIPYHLEIKGYQIGAFHVACAFSLIYYLRIGVGAAVINFLIQVIMAFSVGLGTYLWNWAFGEYDSSETRNLIIILNVVAWGLQFIGHGVFESTNNLIEERKPALLDNIWQILSAPLFVIIEFFDLIGIRPKEIQLWQNQIERNVEQLEAKRREAKKQ